LQAVKAEDLQPTYLRARLKAWTEQGLFAPEATAAALAELNRPAAIMDHAAAGDPSG
jgi:hypothetical protein